MNAELAREVFAIVEANVKSRPSPMEFEMAYQMRVSIDCIRFAIKATDQSTPDPQQLEEAGLQLLDALDRLESADRDFQRRYRQASSSASCEENRKRVNDAATHARNGIGMNKTLKGEV
jgi:hypothetical protein